MTTDTATEKKSGWWDKLTPDEKAALRLRGKLKARVNQTTTNIHRHNALISASSVMIGEAEDKHTRRLVVGGMAIVQRDRHSQRREARCLNLAYAFIRGKSWASVERRYYTVPNTKRIAELIEQHTIGRDGYDYKQRMAEWIDDAIKSGGYVGVERGNSTHV